MEEVRKHGKYLKGKSRTLKVKFSSENVAKKVLATFWKLDYEGGYEKIFLRPDLIKDEREKLGGLMQKVKEWNGERKEEEKLTFLCTVRNMWLRKCFIKHRE